MNKKERKEAYLEALNKETFFTDYPMLKGYYKADKKKWKKLTAKLSAPIEVYNLIGVGDSTTTTATIAIPYQKRFELEDYDFLERYVNQHSPSGQESQGQKVWEKFMDSFMPKNGGLFNNHSKESNCHGTLVYQLFPRMESGDTIKTPAHRVMIEAHCDEISYIVTKISSEGLIYVVRNGGSDEAIAPSKEVLIHTSKGDIRAVFGWIAIHIRERDVNPNRNSIFLDAGFNSREEALRAGIEVGDYVTYNEKVSILNDKIVGKSLDNKIGGYIIAQVTKRLVTNNIKLNYELCISNSVQEEVGLLGAKMVAERFMPDVVIVTDVTHDTTTPGIQNKLIGDIQCGKGPVIVRGAATHKGLEKFIKPSKVPYQIQACSGRGTGTDADEFSYSNGGTPTTLIKMPLKYMHTTVEMCSISDVNATIDLMYDTLLELNRHEFMDMLNHQPNEF